MIKVTIHTRRNNLWDCKVRSGLSQLPAYSTDIEGARRVFELDINKHQRDSVGKPADFYKADATTPVKTFEVWHYKINGDKDRKVATVVEY